MTGRSPEMRFKTRRIEVEATRWFRNGDHPEDESVPVEDDGSVVQGKWDELTEGKVVRRFRHPGHPGHDHCPICHEVNHLHGWIDSGGDGQTVCPGDWVVTLPGGQRVACPHAFFSKAYLVPEAEAGPEFAGGVTTAEASVKRDAMKAARQRQDEEQRWKDEGHAVWHQHGGMKHAPRVDPEVFGPHSYPHQDGTSDCSHGCGCWMGPTRSGGPVDPMGACPENVKAGQVVAEKEQLGPGSEPAGQIPSSDTICVPGIESWFKPPEEPASDPAYVKHVLCKGVRCHVLSWDENGTRCSEPKCIVNRRDE